MALHGLYIPIEEYILHWTCITPEIVENLNHGNLVYTADGRPAFIEYYDINKASIRYNGTTEMDSKYIYNLYLAKTHTVDNKIMIKYSLPCNMYYNMYQKAIKQQMITKPIII